VQLSPSAPTSAHHTLLSHPHNQTLIIEGKGYRVLKLLSEDPANYPDAPREVRKVRDGESGTGRRGLYKQAITKERKQD